MAAIDLTFKVYALSAFHVGTGLGLAGIVDRRTARRREDPVGTKEMRLVCLPGSTIKGRFRWHYSELVQSLSVHKTGLRVCDPDHLCRTDPCLRCTLFGSEAFPGPLVFQDAPLVEPWRNLAYEERGALQSLFETENRTNVSLSRSRGVAFEKLLFGIEVGAARLTFRARITGEMDRTAGTLQIESVTVPVEIALLVAAARTVAHIGGGKSRGLGRCTVAFASLTVDRSPIAETDLLNGLRGWLDALSN